MKPNCSDPRHRPDVHRTNGHCESPAATDALSRRQVLSATGLVAAAWFAGCTYGEEAEKAEPVTMTQSDRCEVCGMVIPNHPGPTTEIFYADQRPSGHDNPARFDSTWEAFQYDFERRDRGWERTVMYVTDYSSVDYSLREEEEGDVVISTHPEADAFVDAEKVTFVVGSEVKGAMGKDLVAFSTESDASSFSDEHGGTLASFEEVTPETIAALRQS